MMEKDCTDELMECTTQCDTNDKECHDDCIEEYHACDISNEFTPDDVEQCITNGTDYKDCVDHMVATNNFIDNIHVDEGEIISEILTLTALLNGKCTRSNTLNSVGRSSKKITIEYDIKERDQGSSQETETNQE